MPAAVLKNDGLLPDMAFVHVNQIIAAVMLFGVITAVFAPLIAESGSQMFARSSSIKESMERSNIQAGQVLAVTHMQQHNGTISIFVSNIGVEDVGIDTVLVDGIEAGYFFRNQDLTEIDILETGELGVLEVTGIGDRVQVITDAGKLVDFSVG